MMGYLFFYKSHFQFKSLFQMLEEPQLPFLSLSSSPIPFPASPLTSLPQPFSLLPIHKGFWVLEER